MLVGSLPTLSAACPPWAWGSFWDPTILGRSREGCFEARGEMWVARFRNAVFGSGGLQCLWSERGLTPSVPQESGVSKLWWVSLPPPSFTGFSHGLTPTISVSLHCVQQVGSIVCVFFYLLASKTAWNPHYDKMICIRRGQEATGSVNGSALKVHRKTGNEKRDCKKTSAMWFSVNVWTSCSAK